MKIKYFPNKLSNHLMLIFSLLTITLNVEAATPLADQPTLVSGDVPSNIALTLSVEWPTALSDAYSPVEVNSLGVPTKISSYKASGTYLGYFDEAKCYDYDANNHYFVPVLTTSDHTCKGATRRWSGNFLNWALTQTIDPLRKALTGGYRSIDTPSLTVLEKAYAPAAQGRAPTIKTIVKEIDGAVPYEWSNFSLKIGRQGNTFVFTNKGNLGQVALTDELPEVPTGTEDKEKNTQVYRMYARVQVCASKDLKEANCTAYSGGMKPEGLIQKNATKLNFAAFGYLLDPDFRRDGGVLRARMAPLGPMRSVYGKPDEKNVHPDGSSASEWSSTTGVFVENPDQDDASNTAVTTGSTKGVPNSGVINYLNKFGLYAKSYKSADNVSELYYTAIRYFKHSKDQGGGNVAAYSANLTPEIADGFPVITDWDDPIKYGCQSNFIIGVGDSNTWADGNLPGSTMHSSNERTPPQEVTDDKTVNVATATNKVGKLEGLKNLGDMYIPWTMDKGETLTGGTFYIAGLAYDAHTNDMRTDLADSQTVSTYWLDVLEKKAGDPYGPDRHNYGDIAGMRNPFWLAAKYGGFEVPTDFDPDTTTSLKTELWNTRGGPDSDPDNYFRADNPALMIENLNKAFSSILSVPSGFSGNFNLKSLSVESGDMSYGTSYDNEGWTGDVTASKVSLTSGKENGALWSAAKILESQDWNSGRYIATSNCVASSSSTQRCTGTPFRLSGLSSANKANLVATNQQSLLNFLRGDKSNAGYRDRSQILGDIGNSQVFVNGAPDANYSDKFNPGYSKFKEDNASRQTALYVGANDGMLHAFNGAESGGNELFAYVPQALFAGPNNTPAVDGLAALASPDYVHHYYVDASPVVIDVNFGAGASDWHSLLVGGLGKGGKSYFAIDVTHPETLSNEGKLADAIKWEFTHPHMGYTYGKPVIVKTEKYGWVVILTSGYNNDDGKGYFFILNPSTGDLLQAIPTGQGSTSNDAGLATASAYVNDYRDYTADSVYAGDMLGNVWRLDLTGKPDQYPAPIKIAELTSPTGTPQPVTVAPRIEVDKSTSKRYVFVGTGRFLDSSDVMNTQGQTFYAIHDGINSAFFTTSTAPIIFPFHRKDMSNNTDLKTGLAVSLPDGKTGWYIDLGWGANGVGYRIDQDLNSGAGVIAFVANLPTGNACKPSGVHDLYALTYGTGKSVLLDNGVVVDKIAAIPGLGGSPAIFDTKEGLKIGDSSTTEILNKINDLNELIDPGFKILNWRGITNGN